MNALFYLLLLLNLAFGVLSVHFLVIRDAGTGDPGQRSITMPFLALMGITAVQMIDYYLQPHGPGNAGIIFSMVYSLLIVAIALAWNNVTYEHYVLNGVAEPRPGVRRSFLILAAVLGVATVVAELFVPSAVLPVHLCVLAWLFYAGIRGVLILRRSRSLLPSSRLAVTIAALSLFLYPLVTVGDILGWRLPFLDPHLSFWTQTHPLYITVISIPVAVFRFRQRSGSGKDGEATRRSTNSLTFDPAILDQLTDREHDVIRLLSEGHRYREIGERLNITHATVRTHVHHIYGKLGISRREELLVALTHLRHRETGEE